MIDAAKYRLSWEKIRRDNRVQPTDSRNGDTTTGERGQLNTISKSIADNDRFTGEKIRRHSGTLQNCPQMDNLRSSAEIITRDEIAEQIVKQNDIQRLRERGKQLKTISISIEANSDERSTYEGSERINKEEPTDTRKETHGSRRRVISEKQSVFHRIFTYGLVFCLPLSNLLFSKKRDQETRKNCLKLWIIVGTAFKTLFFAVLCVYNNLLWPSFATDCLYMANCMSGYVLTWIFLLKGRKIISTVRKISSLTSLLYISETEEVPDPMSIYFPVSIIGVYVLLASQVYFLFISQWESVTENIKSFIPFPEDSANFRASCSLVLLSAMLSFNTSLLTLYVALYLTGAAYRHSGNLFTLYGKKLKKDIERGYFTAQTAHESISQFQNVLSCAAEVDNTFNVITFVICAEIYVLFFAYPCTLLNPDQRLKSMEVNLFGAVCFKIALDMLIYLFYSGDKFYNAIDELKKDTIALSGSLMNLPSVDSSTLVMFNLLSRQIKEAKPCVTAWGLYDVNSRLIPNVVGALISYGVLIDEFGANSS